ncbi:hypothetical protein RQP46_008184 [Phenoliferia psychrophenolica]
MSALSAPTRTFAPPGSPNSTSSSAVDAAPRAPPSRKRQLGGPTGPRPDAPPPTTGAQDALAAAGEHSQPPRRKLRARASAFSSPPAPSHVDQSPTSPRRLPRKSVSFAPYPLPIRSTTSSSSTLAVKSGSILPRRSIPFPRRAAKAAAAAAAAKASKKSIFARHSWIDPQHLAMIPISPAIVLRPAVASARPSKNPHSERVGPDGLVRDRASKTSNGKGETEGRSLPKKSESFGVRKRGGSAPSVAQGKEILIDALPPIWCLGRQELCEALPYFKAYQSGHFTSNGRCFGYLLDGYPSVKDCCADGGKVIISHGGGCSKVTPSEGYHLTSDQTRDNRRVRALINCHKTYTPVVLIAGASYEYFPWLKTRKIRYAVLGHYFVDMVWAEAEPKQSDPSDFFVRFKFRFVWVPSQGEPWFGEIIGGAPPSPVNLLTTGLPETTCQDCHRVATAVYQEEIGCYNERCPSFFKVHGTTVVANPKSLTFRSAFLRATDNPSWPTSVPLDLLPQSMDDIRATSANYSEAGWRGFHCDQCGRLSSRSQWHQVECECCGATMSIAYEGAKIKLGLSLHPSSVEKLGAGIETSPIELEGFVGTTYTLSSGAKVHHLRPTSKTTLAKTNRFFDAYQAPDASKLLRRNTLSMRKIPGQYLCSQFSFNSGARYDHVVAVPTYSFDESPDVVRDARTFLESVSRAVISESTPADAVDFNELLSVGYMNGSKMNFHDDGERGLGPVVATLSLGGDATLSFRKKEDTGKPASKGSRRSSRKLLTLKLRHGDITIMEGEDVQRMYEHGVEIDGELRYAATCRKISSEHYV